MKFEGELSIPRGRTFHDVCVFTNAETLDKLFGGHNGPTSDGKSQKIWNVKVETGPNSLGTLFIQIYDWFEDPNYDKYKYTNFHIGSCYNERIDEMIKIPLQKYLNENDQQKPKEVKDYTECKVNEMIAAIPEIVKLIDSPITKHEWFDDTVKFTIVNKFNSVYKSMSKHEVTLLAFRTEVERDMFIEKNYKLIKRYLMIDDDEVD